MTYTISDLHGRYDLYAALLKKIRFCEEDTLYILGDSIDRGPDGIKILFDTAARRNVVHLLGNHEDMALPLFRREALPEIFPNEIGPAYYAMLRENGAELQRGSAAADADSVTVMTMHRSKGLEFPFVILGGLGRKFNLRERSNVLTVSHEYGVGLKRREPENIKLYDTLSSKAVRLAGKTAALSEEMRILYVALTRAKEKLFLLASCKNPRERLKQTEALLPARGPLPPFAVSSADTPFKWLMSVCLRHPDAEALRQLGARPVPEKGRLRCAVVTAPQEAAAEAPAAAVPADPVLVEELRARMAFSYPWLPVSALRAKHAASSLAEERFSPAQFAAAAPAFLFSDALTPAEKGTATHRFLECCDYAQAAADAEKELRRLVAAGKLSARESAGVPRVDQDIPGGRGNQIAVDHAAAQIANHVSPSFLLRRPGIFPPRRPRKRRHD